VNLRVGANPDPVDVLVIGAGMGGAAISKILAEAGLSVVCLEQGPWVQPDQRPHSSPNYEIQRTSGSWHTSPNVRGFAHDYPVTGDSVLPLMYNGVGGSTVHFTGTWPRYRPSDFRRGTEHGLCPDWPITYEDLHPFYAINDREMGIAGLAGDPSYPAREARQTPPVPPGRTGQIAARGFEKLGWHWWPCDMAVITQQYDGRTPCNNCGNCQSGCPHGSIANTAVTYWPKALRAGADLRPNCRVEEITVDQEGRATGAAYIDRLTGTRYRQRADIVVVCCNGIGTPRLLLASRSGKYPDGLANSSDQVGRNLMHHGIALVEHWVPERLDSHMGVMSAPCFSMEFAETDPARGAVNGIALVICRNNGAGFQAMGSLTANVAPWGKDHHRWFKEHFDHVLGVLVYSEDLPMPENRVTLDPLVKDSDGIPAPHVAYTLHPNDRKLLDFGVERAMELGRAIGAFESKVQRYATPTRDYQPPAWHLLGTCRMGDDPAASVTNKWHQSWDIANLYICDGSSVVTSASINPTSTIGALAVRCAHHLRDHFAELRQATRTTAE
jgi:choline dehydrogenase-like flavoprotein